MYFTIKLPHSLHGDTKNQEVSVHGNCCHMKTSATQNTSTCSGKKPRHVKKRCRQERSTHIFLQCELEVTVLCKIVPQDFVVEVTIPYFAGHTVMHDYLVGAYIVVIVDVVDPACNYIHRHFTVWPHGLDKITQVGIRRFALNDLGSIQT